MKSKQAGSAHIIIIVILAVALLGALGWIFWTKVSEKNPAKATAITKETSSDTTKRPKTNYMTDSIGSPFGETITFSYPDTWSIAKTVSGPTPANDTNFSQDSATIRSKNGLYEVTYGISNGGIGGTCSPEDSGTVLSLDYEKIPSDPSVAYVNYIFKGKSGGYTGKVGVSRFDIGNGTTLTNIQSGDSTCKVGLGVLTSYNVAHGGFANLIITTRIGSADATVDETQSLDEIKRRVSTDDFKELKKIILSTNFEKSTF